VQIGLDKVLGEGGMTAVMYHLKLGTPLPTPAEFHKKLLVLFGPQGASSLEKVIVKELATKLKWSLDFRKMDRKFDFNATVAAVEKGTSKRPPDKAERRYLPAS
jgi:hypothetical protein